MYFTSQLRNIYHPIPIPPMYNTPMDYKSRIEHALEHIEANLTSELSLAGAAKAAGYSEYHFLRIFKEATGLTPADYIRKRRLSEIAREIISTSQPIAQIAYKYGFNSKENFIRAFKAEHNILPTEYKSAMNSLKLFGRLQLAAPAFEATPEVVTIEGFSLTVFENREDYIPRFWNWYNGHKLSARLSGGKTVPDYGVSKWNDKENRLEYFIGIQTADAAGDITGTVKLDIPGGLYAVFTTPPTTHSDFINMVHRTWQYINKTWLPQSGYARAGEYEFETYVEASRTFSEKIYIPVAKKDDIL